MGFVEMFMCHEWNISPQGGYGKDVISRLVRIERPFKGMRRSPRDSTDRLSAFRRKGTRRRAIEVPSGLGIWTPMATAGHARGGLLSIPRLHAPARPDPRATQPSCPAPYKVLGRH